MRPHDGRRRLIYMATKTKKGKKQVRKTNYPVARRFTVSLPAQTTSYVDVGAILSRINQRLYRQGRGYHISSVEINNTTTGFKYAKIETLPHSWFVNNAHKLAFAAWRNSTKEERAMGVKTAQWSDFKVFFDENMLAPAGGGAVITRPDGLSAMTTGEWRYTTAVDANSVFSTNRAFWMLDGASGATGFNMVEEYDNARNTNIEDDQPTMTYEVPYESLSMELNDEQADMMVQQGDLPPYESVNEVDNLITPLWEVFTGGGGGSGNQDDKIKEYGIYAPCGLLRVTAAHVPTGGDPVGVTLTIEVKAGDYKGVAGELMY